MFLADMSTVMISCVWSGQSENDSIKQRERRGLTMAFSFGLRLIHVWFIIVLHLLHGDSCFGSFTLTPTRIILKDVESKVNVQTPYFLTRFLLQYEPVHLTTFWYTYM